MFQTGVVMQWSDWLSWLVLLVLLFTSKLSGETQGGLCSYTATNNTLLCSNLTRLHLLTGSEESLANLHNLQIVDSKVGVLSVSRLSPRLRPRLSLTEPDCCR